MTATKRIISFILEDIKMAKCKKSNGVKKDLKAAVANTLQNKIAKLEKRLRDNPNQPVVRNALLQARYDLAKHWGMK